MIGLFKKAIIAGKQKALSKRYPGVNISLHQEMPFSSVDKLTETAKTVELINSLEPEISGLSDAELKAKTLYFKEAISKRSKQDAVLLQDLEASLMNAAIPEEKDKMKERLKLARNRIFDDILPEAFAVVREASRRVIGLRHFDIQLSGGIILHEGRIAEMATGEGKTLAATLPAYLNALLGRGVHVITVNDYLARRDRCWMGPVYEFLGLSVGTIQHDMSDAQRKQAYSCDITYGTNNEFGFDYLRDNMKYRLEDIVQRPFYYAIVDEVDSILIDEARTPLIISGPAEESTDKYYKVDKIIPRLKGRLILEKDQIDAKYKGEDFSKGYDYIIDEKSHTAHLTEEGESKACQILGISDIHSIETMEWRHHIIQALRAHNLYRKDTEYVVNDGQVIIVDEFTGRLMPGRRWSDGLHQAVEAKEGLKIERENQTLAMVTFQNYFRMYEKLAGMTGTAFTEANEFKGIYKLDVVVMPTNKPLIRTNYPDRIYKTEKEKFDAVLSEINALYEQGRPVLVGTISIDKSEHLSGLLKRKGIKHQVLNAKYHEQEAQIVAQAGSYQAVTIATNMAGRGTDILLGGNAEFIAASAAGSKFPDDRQAYAKEYNSLLDKYKITAKQDQTKIISLGGLHVIATERHEARRIDNQLRGRSGRQGDPGSSRFYVSLEDDLMRLFGSDRLVGIMERLGIEEGQVIEHGLVTRSIEVAQRRIEQHNFEIRKQLLEYDNVMNKQREVIYHQRRQLLEKGNCRDEILEIVSRIVENNAELSLREDGGLDDWDKEGLIGPLKLIFGVDIQASSLDAKNKQEIVDTLTKEFVGAYEEKERSLGEGLMRHLEVMVFLQIIDAKWKDHLYAMDSLREGISLRAYGQRDPLIEYKKEAFIMFNQMIQNIEEEAVEMIFRLQPAKPEKFKGVFSSISQEYSHPQAESFKIQEKGPSLQSPAPVSNSLPQAKDTQAKVGRNDPCPCGSGKKFKKCCGR